ncbi:MAG TPA: hypothetical protein VGO00_01425, partial [Kofleriaceae bacterium]|nr:hypothetical protein [Kofleriaceae bacterium]
MRGVALLFATAACASAPPPAKPEPPAKDVVVFPPPPVFRLDHTFEPTSYRARIAFAEPRFTGAIEISGTLAEPTKTIWLHGDGIAITSAVAVHDGAKVPLEFVVANDETVIGLQAREPLPAGAWTLVIDYTGGIDLTEPPPYKPFDPKTSDPRKWKPPPKTFGIF